MTIYAFEFCFCPMEGGFVVQSLHTTMRGAYRAMNGYLNKTFTKEYDKRMRIGKYYVSYAAWHPWYGSIWRIKKHEVLED